MPTNIHLQARELKVMTWAKIKLHVSYLGITDMYETQNEGADEVSYGTI